MTLRDEQTRTQVQKRLSAHTTPAKLHLYTAQAEQPERVFLQGVNAAGTAA